MRQECARCHSFDDSQFTYLLISPLGVEPRLRYLCDECGQRAWKRQGVRQSEIDAA